ncbi:hypothetical protein MTR_1g100637 [Medicago truncatula]|uniref:Uncharacterized protein n=1 Tax=Medicago truncatula TaxID=3880 RepID=G8A214_MEDTR|nr:hypothetical protein MTR_1g100637 [Medicago truncatula]
MKEKKTGLGWPVSRGARKEPGSGSIFQPIFKPGFLARPLKAIGPARPGLNGPDRPFLQHVETYKGGHSPTRQWRAVKLCDRFVEEGVNVLV